MSSKDASDDTAEEELRSYIVAVEVAADNRADPLPVPHRLRAELLNAYATGSHVNYSKGDKDDPCCDTYSLAMKCLQNTKNDVDECKTLTDKYEMCHPPKDPRLCPAHELAFEEGLQENVGEIKLCQFWMDMMSKCLRRNNQWF